MPHSLMQRAQIILLSARASPIDKWRATAELRHGRSALGAVATKRGWAGLHDELRPWRPRTHDDEQVTELIRLVTH
jgi:hypothetical protein